MTTNFRGYSQLVVDNLRRTHGPKLEKYTDQQIIDVYADWNMSDKTEDMIDWMDSVSTYNNNEKAKGNS